MHNLHWLLWMEQDQLMEVRGAFGAKLRTLVLLMNKQQPQRASKYAAMLPLAGMDPNEANRSALLQLSAFVSLQML